MDIYVLFALISSNIQRIRKDLGLSQEQFAKELGITRNFLAKIESSNIKQGMSLDTLFLISKKYNIDIREFFSGYEKLLDKH